ncbi:MAG: NADPH:quinone reductase and related Zn-dependent oxidoreductase, partial [Microbacteriaceae bacterium]|nr:NADPH:quinone reductase and related Zn-dependent oxidoreductase [Microbacteriaceae bacterium]
GVGSDFAGVVTAVGPAVDSVAIGDQFVGFSDWRNSQAEFVTLLASHVVPKPLGVSWDEAGALFVAGTTAVAAISSIDLKPGDTVVIAGAAGGVGSVASQLAVLAGATVIGTAGEENHDALREYGVLPVAYGDGVADRIRAVAPNGVDAFLDLHGSGNVELALELGVARDRIDTIIDFGAVERHGVKARGMSTVEARPTMLELLAMLERGELALPVYARFPLGEVRAAYERLAERHGFGKIVLDVHPAP